jgi:Holliday junction resolvasome RuvABC endonuclease subunit
MVKRATGRTIVLSNGLQHPISILGLDCSSATIGWGLIALNSDPVLLAYGHIKPLKSKYMLLERLNDVYDRIDCLCDQLQPTHIAIEDIVLFMKNKSQAQTITILASFNRVVALAAYKKVPQVTFYSVHEIRKLIKIGNNLSFKIGKDDMPEIIRGNLAQNFGEIINKRGNLAKETFDESDGIAVAWAHAIDLRG